MYRTPELKIEIRSGMSIEDIHELLADALEFPEYCSKNWDAFEECFNDDETSNPPVTLVLCGWHIFISEHPNDARIFWDCITGKINPKKPTEFFFAPRACACCNYLTLQDWNSASFECCSVCGWEDDAVGYEDPDKISGANARSLNQAKERFQASSRVSDKVQDFRNV